MMDVTEGESIKRVDSSCGTVRTLAMLPFLDSSREQKEMALCFARMSCELFSEPMRASTFIRKKQKKMFYKVKWLIVFLSC